MTGTTERTMVSLLVFTHPVEGLIEQIRPFMSDAGYALRPAFTPSELMMEVRAGTGAAILLSLAHAEHPRRLVRDIRREVAKPILLVRGRDDEELALDLIDLGATDYICRDVSCDNQMALRELRTRLAASLRMSYRRNVDGDTDLVFGDLRVDPTVNRAWRGDVAIALTELEYRLLIRLLQSPGELIPAEVLLRDVWSDSRTADKPYLRTYASRLRKKLGWNATDKRGPRLESRRNQGYGILWDS